MLNMAACPMRKPLLDAAQARIDGLTKIPTAPASRVGLRCTALQKQEHIEPAFKALSEVLTSSLAQLEDAVHTLRSYLRKTELDPIA
jgi:DNA repair protein RecN (Recombination protein N)